MQKANCFGYGVLIFSEISIFCGDRKHSEMIRLQQKADLLINSLCKLDYYQ